jgi:phosphoadenosine phosphosulfate reductase
MVSSFGAESAVLLDMVASVDRNTPVIFLETGKLFPETLAYKDELVRSLGLQDVRVIRPDPADLARFDPNGDLWQREPDMCCHIRKTEPLDRALEGFVGWITGRKRFQGGKRATLPTIEQDPVSGLLKLNPLANWSLEDIRHYRRLRQLPLHPLLSRGYLSIGCAPCTRAVKEGEDVRAGRWWQLDKTECGIHRS